MVHGLLQAANPVRQRPPALSCSAMSLRTYMGTLFMMCVEVSGVIGSDVVSVCVALLPLGHGLMVFST
jgi:hypothetical protein